MREEKRFSLEGKDNQQKTYDNETGECTSGQRPIFIQDRQAHLGNKGTDPINGLGMLGHVHRLVKGEQSDKDNKRVVKEDCRIKETKKDERDNTRFVWSPPLLSSTPLDTASGTSHDLRVD